VIAAVMLAHERTGRRYDVYNVATGDEISVSDIAALAVECVGLEPASVRFAYGGGDRGWKGDVPIVRLDTSKIRALGFRPARSSRQALSEALKAMIPLMKEGKM
jgi:UDP-glucose 4-epimerase